MPTLVSMLARNLRYLGLRDLEFSDCEPKTLKAFATAAVAATATAKGAIACLLGGAI